MIFEINNHKFTNYDLTKFDLKKYFMSVDAMYVDPPWSQSNYRYWRTMNEDKHNHHDFIEFINVIIQLGISTTDNRNILLIEVGKSFADKFENILANYREIKNFKRYKSYYQKNYWNYYYCINFDLEEFDLPERMTGNKLTDFVFQKFQQIGVSTVFDPCLGLGTTLKYCIKYTMTCLGNEVNLERLKKAIERKLGYKFQGHLRYEALRKRENQF